MRVIPKRHCGHDSHGAVKALHVAIHELVDLQYSTYNRSLLPLLEKNGLHIVREHEQLTAEEAAYVDQYFQENVILC